MGQTNFLQSLGWAILNSLWQLALLWVVYQAITGIYKNARSSFRSLLATTLLFSGFGWFVYTFLSAFITRIPENIHSSVFVNPAANESVNAWLEKTLPVASIVYLALLVFPVMHFVRNYRYVQVIRRFGLTKIDVSWKLFVTRITAQMNIRKKVQIWVSEFVSSPVTIGYLKPIILVPLAAINHLSPQQLEAVLLHELSHIRRHDYLVNLLINIIQSVLYFNPFVKGFVKIIEREREKSCDEMVLQFQYNAHDYASALLTLEQANQSAQPFVMAASGKKNDLLHRVELILGVNKKRVFSFQRIAGMMAGLLCIIALQALLLLVNGTSGKSISGFPGITSSRLIEAVHTAYNSAYNGRVSEQPASSLKTTALKPAKASAVASIQTPVNPDFLQASFEFATAPELKKYQEQQVEQAMEASKKVLESVQWKIVEKNIADAFTQKEKEALKITYEKQLKKIDWNQWENKLRLAYNKIDWEKVNAQLAQAVTEVRIDSMQTLYNSAIAKIDDVRKELAEKELPGVPDSDISLKELEAKRVEVRKALNELKSTKTKKIVHL